MDFNIDESDMKKLNSMALKPKKVPEEENNSNSEEENSDSSDEKEKMDFSAESAEDNDKMEVHQVSSDSDEKPLKKKTQKQKESKGKSKQSSDDSTDSKENQSLKKKKKKKDEKGKQTTLEKWVTTTPKTTVDQKKKPEKECVSCHRIFKSGNYICKNCKSSFDVSVTLRRLPKSIIKKALQKATKKQQLVIDIESSEVSSGSDNVYAAQKRIAKRVLSVDSTATTDSSEYKRGVSSTEDDDDIVVLDSDDSSDYKEKQKKRDQKRGRTPKNDKAKSKSSNSNNTENDNDSDSSFKVHKGQKKRDDSSENNNSDSENEGKPLAKVIGPGRPKGSTGKKVKKLHTLATGTKIALSYFCKFCSKIYADLPGLKYHLGDAHNKWKIEIDWLSDAEDESVSEDAKNNKISKRALSTDATTENDTEADTNKPLEKKKDGRGRKPGSKNKVYEDVPMETEENDSKVVKGWMPTTGKENEPLVQKVKVEPKLCNDCEEKGLDKCDRLCRKMTKANEALKEMNLRKQSEIKNSKIISLNYKCRLCDFETEESSNIFSHHLEEHYIDQIE